MPYLGPALEETVLLLDLLDSRDHPGRGTYAELREELDLLRAESHRRQGPVQAVHGDAHAGNLLATPDGPRWIDFEEACLGPVGWDLACMLGSGRRAVQEYGVDPDDPGFGPFLRARRLQAALWMLAKTLSFPEETPRALAVLDDWRRNRFS